MNILLFKIMAFGKVSTASYELGLPQDAILNHHHAKVNL